MNDETKSNTWLLLIVSLPSSSATARMRIWRSLKALGCGLLRDGVYLLPDRPQAREELQQLSDETVSEGGSAWLLTVSATRTQQEVFRSLLARDEDYVDLRESLAEARKTLDRSGPQDIARLLRRLRRDYEALRAIDYFPNEASAQAETDWMDFVNAAEAILSPGEPHSVSVPIPRLRMQDYQGRLWATRAHLWVDRVTSAWLIRRFIDSEARFLWLASPNDCPKDALGFDFDGAAFTHVGDRVSFEVLAASFGLDDDRGIARLGAVVRALDTGGIFVPEASGFQAILAGVRQRAPDDNALLAEMSKVLDALYFHFSKDLQNHSSSGGTSQ